MQEALGIYREFLCRRRREPASEGEVGSLEEREGQACDLREERGRGRSPQEGMRRCPLGNCEENHWRNWEDSVEAKGILSDRLGRTLAIVYTWKKQLKAWEGEWKIEEKTEGQNSLHGTEGTL